ncbi:hypothetical protein GGI05_004153 [Coemansia sp. RSA 2603]|nr:hypothetical protein GGI05_004153 [Coemansia sp. RSA 2603]
MEARRRARDVCAVAKDALALLRRLLAHATPWLDFGALRMDARVGALLARLVAGRLPPVISAVVEQAHKEKEEEAGGGGSARQMCVRASEPRSALLVDRLLHVAGQPHASPHTDPNRLYAAPVLAALWQEYCAAGCLLAAQLVEQSLARAADDGALAKALHVAGSMRPRASVQESLAASSMLPFRVLLPMALGSGDPGRVLLHRAGPLWDALAAAFPPAEVAGALGRAATLRACLLAALLLPPVDHTKRAQPLAAVLRSVAGVLVRGASQHATSALCSSVLRFLACRQHAAVHRSLARCVVALDASAVRALREFSQSLTAQQLQQQKHAGLLDDSVGLSARGGLVHVSRALLVAASPVFGVMLDGGFAESSAVRADVPVELDCAHDGLAALVDVLQRLVALLSHTHEQTDDQISAALRTLGSELDRLYATPVRAALLELAVYYDVRPVAAFALCMALWDVEQAHCVPEIVAVLADLVAEDWSAVFGLQVDAEALVHRAVCAVVFLHDGVDLTALDESAVDLIADSTGGLFDMSSNLL